MTTEESHELMAPLLPAYELNLLDEEDRNQMDAHVIACNQCFEVLYHFDPVTAAVHRIKEGKKKKASLRIERPKWQWLMTVIMALLLVMAFWLFQKSSGLQKELMRGAAQIQLLAPANDSDVTPPVIFQWEEEPEANFYKIYVFRNEKMLVAGERTGSPYYNWTSAANAEKGSYHWKVESYFSDGTRIRDSVINEFELSR